MKGAAFAIDALAPFPKRWKCPSGPITVMCVAVKGYLMVSRPGAVPFVMSVDEILNASRRPHPLGPFEPVVPSSRTPAKEHQP